VRDISSPNRSMFFQSIASNRSQWARSEAMGSGDRQIIAATSPPRIWGPLERTMCAYQPLSPAASNSALPTVITPAPPLPATVIDNLFWAMDLLEPLTNLNYLALWAKYAIYYTLLFNVYSSIGTRSRRLHLRTAMAPGGRFGCQGMTDMTTTQLSLP